MSEYPYPEFDQEGKVVCQLCGKSLNIISPSHLRKHDVNLQQYQEKFKDIHVTSEKFRVVSRFCHSPALAPTPKPLNEIMEEITVDQTITQQEDLTKIIEKASEETTKVNILPPSKLKSKNPMQEMKMRILLMLKQYFLNIHQDYEVQIFTGSGHLQHEFITDFADPNQKIVINFPKTFWHNKNPDPAANKKLSEYGWKVIEIYSIAPGNKEIAEVLKPYLK
jgi:hypothetical protein